MFFIVKNIVCGSIWKYKPITIGFVYIYVLKYHCKYTFYDLNLKNVKLVKSSHKKIAIFNLLFSRKGVWGIGLLIFSLKNCFKLTLQLLAIQITLKLI